jgi:hypothetical protein
MDEIEQPALGYDHELDVEIPAQRGQVSRREDGRKRR